MVDDPVDEDAERPSKSQRKRDMHALQALGAQLLELNAAQLERIDLPEGLREALAFARTITSHEARRRQLQYIGKLMRNVEGEAIRAAFERATGDSRAATALMHRCERLRERLLADDDALTEFVAAHPRADVQRLRATIRAARRELAAGHAPRHARELYRALHALLEQESHDARAT
jgi:ribosome-associated protein